MDDKKFRKISKKDLLEILLAQAKRIEKLEQELNKTKSKLNSKKIAIKEAGSLAEASLKLNGIFEAAQEAIEQYMINIKEKCKKIENDTKKECQKLKKEADDYLAKIKLKVKELTKNTDNLTKDTKTVVNKDKNVINGRPVKTVIKDEETSL